jgi:tRNA (guanine-N7-)-methyltransferase
MMAMGAIGKYFDARLTSGDGSISAVKPYADAPRLPDGERIDLASLVRGAWIEIELGPGRGGFIVDRALVEPTAAMLGFEVRRKWASIVDARLAKMGLASRARVLAEDARVALVRLAPNASVQRVFSHFPDPWWKKRHQKRLMFAPALLEEIARLLEPGGELFLQTDVEERAVQYERMLADDPRFVAHGDALGSARLVDNPYGARSPREKRAMADGLPIFRIRYARVASVTMRA